jgi:nucleoid DNA-binding protein
MRTDDIAKNVSTQFDISFKNSKEIVKTVFSGIKDSIVKGERVIVNGFGSFKLKTVKERLGRNPKTGEPITIPERKVTRFKPGSFLKKASAGKPKRVKKA